MNDYFAKPDDTVRLPFSGGPLDGEWIQIRRRISHLEEQELLRHLVSGIRQDDDAGTRTMELNGADYDAYRLRFWVKRWSLGTADERGMKPTREQLDTLLPEFAAPILKAIADHEEALKAEAEVASSPLPESGTTTEPSLTPELDSSGTP